MTKFFTILSASCMVASAALAGDTPSPEGAEVYMVNLNDGDTVQSPFTVVFGLKGMGVAPAGVERENTGHHHMFVNRPALGEAEGDDVILSDGIPADENHIHYGAGQTEATYDLPAGTYTMQLVLGDHFHIPHDPPVVSQRITVTVSE